MTLHIDKNTLGIYKKYSKKADKSFILGAAYNFSKMFEINIYTQSALFKAEKLPLYLLNWGYSESVHKIAQSKIEGTVIINKPSAVELAVSKMLTLETLHLVGLPALSYTTSKEVVSDWLAKDGLAYRRYLTRASGGRGIKIIKKEEDIRDLSFHTKYYPSNREYRVHVFDGEVIDIQIKRKRSKKYLEDNGITVDPYVRNLEGGYVFCRTKCRKNKNMMDVCVRAVQSLGLDFGAVDVLANVENNKLMDFCIAEVNTAPGLEGTTMASYIDAILKFINKNTEKPTPSKESIKSFMDSLGV